jgi:hypothetical protein
LHFQYTPKEIHEKLKSHIPHNARRHLDPPPMPVPTPAKPIHLIAQERMAEKPKPHVFISSPTKPQPTKPLHIIAQERKASVL